MAEPVRRSRQNSSPGTARNSLDRAAAGKRLGLSVARLAGDEGEQADPSLLDDDGSALLSRPFSPYPYPSETRGSSILGAPTARTLPEKPPDRPKMASR